MAKISVFADDGAFLGSGWADLHPAGHMVDGISVVHEYLFDPAVDIKIEKHECRPRRIAIACERAAISETVFCLSNLCLYPGDILRVTGVKWNA